jgi:hypothetical protein
MPSPEQPYEAGALRERAQRLRYYAVTLPAGDDAADKLRAYADELEARAAELERRTPDQT